MVAQLVPAGSEISEICQCSISGDAGGCETSVPEDAESATAPSQNTECGDLELTTCLGSWYLPLGTRGKDTFYCSSCLAPQHGDLFLPSSYAGTLCSCVYQQMLAACSVLPLLPSSHQFYVIVRTHEKNLELRELKVKPMPDGITMNTIYALNLGNMHILTCVFLWTLMLFLTGVSVPLTSCLAPTKLHPLLQ